MKFVMNDTQTLLHSLGLKSLDKQFFSFVAIVLIVIFVVTNSVLLGIKLSSDTAAINLLGKQRLLSQHMAKEAMMVANKIGTFKRHQHHNGRI